MSEHEGLVDSFGREIKPRDIYDERNRDSARESSREIVESRGQEPKAVSSELKRPNRDPHDSALVANRKISGEYNQRIPKRRFEGNDISYSNGGGGGKLSRFDSSDNRDRVNLNNNREWGHPPTNRDNARPLSRYSGGRELRDGRFPSRTGPFGRGAGGRGREGGGNNYNRENRPTERGQLPPPAPPAPPLPPKDEPNTSLRIHQVIPPLVTFKTFMQYETDDLSPEEFQKRYDEYNLQYVHDFCEAFFNVSKSELWFQDRYNPLRFQELEHEGHVWAREEATRIKADLESEHTKIVIKNMCLNKVYQKKPFADKEVGPSGKHFSGHEYRTLKISGLHSACTLPMLKASIAEALTSISCAQPERVVIAQPTWTKTIPSKFERRAWVVMPTVEALHTCLKSFQEKGILITVTGPVDPVNGEASVRTRFNAQIQQHFIRSNIHTLPEHLSHPHRISIDTFKACQLADLLDTDKNVPEDIRLSTILKNTKIHESCELITDKLDIAIAYLRRVHFVTFYGGRLFQDEAHLLTMAPSCILRSPPKPALVLKYFGKKNTPTSVSKTAVKSSVTNSSNENTTVMKSSNETTDETVAEAVVEEGNKGGEGESEDIAAASTTHDDEENENDEVQGEDVGDDHENDHDNENDNDIDLIHEKYEQNVDFNYVERDQDVITDTDENAAVVVTSSVIAETSGTVDVEPNVFQETEIATVNDEKDLEPTAVSHTQEVSDTNISVSSTNDDESKTIPVVSDLATEKQLSVLNSAVGLHDSTLSAQPTNTAAFAMKLFTEQPSENVKRGRSDANIETLIRGIMRKLSKKAQLSKIATPTTTSTVANDETTSTLDKTQQIARIESHQPPPPPPPLPRQTFLSKDEEDASIIKELNEKILTECVEVKSKKEKDEKVRCWFPFCNKLFKNLDFLKKHVILKHDYFAADLILSNAEPFMRARFEAEDILLRPLPPIEYEVAGGRVERKSVKDILSKYDHMFAPLPMGVGPPIPPPPLPMGMGGGLGIPPPVGPPPFHHNDNNHHFKNNDRGGGGGGDRFGNRRHSYHDRQESRQHQIRGGRGGYDNRDGGQGKRDHHNPNRSSHFQNRNSFPPSRDSHNTKTGINSPESNLKSNTADNQSGTGNGNQPADISSTNTGRTSDVFKRKLSTYMDVDAPKETVKEIDYGVSVLPPVKKRKSLQKKL